MSAGEEVAPSQPACKIQEGRAAPRGEGLRMPAGEEAAPSPPACKIQEAGLNHGERHCHTILI